MELIYFANPFCSWCWGFAPIMERLQTEYPRLRITVGLGRLGVQDRQPLSANAREKIAEHWTHVTELSGQPFDHTVLQRAGLTYNTLPACQVLGLVRETYPAMASQFLARLGERFFQLSQDLCDPNTLASAAAEFGLDRDEVMQSLHENRLKSQLLEEWRQCEGLGIAGYPTLLALRSAKPEVVTMGWASFSEIYAKLDELADRTLD